MRRLVHVAPLALLLAHCSSTKSEAPAPPPLVCDPGRGEAVLHNGFTRYAVDTAADGPGYVDVADMNGDGRRDLVVTNLGAVKTEDGNVTLSRAKISIYLQGASLGCWQKTDVVANDPNLYFANRPSAVDVDGDGDLDILVPAGFFVCSFDKTVGACGALAWFENDRGTWKRHDIVPNGDTRFYHHAVHVDFDGDGVKDLVTVAESAASGGRAVWFKGDKSPERFDRTPNVLGDGLGSFPVVADIDGDGDLDVASAEYFSPDTSFAWLERAAAGSWVRHPIDTTSGRGFMVELVPNLYGDGVTRMVATNHTNTTSNAEAVESSVFVFERSSDPTAVWSKTTISRGIVSRPSEGTKVQGAPGVFGFGDIDGDGDVDLAVAGDGDARTFWLEQTSPGTFATHVLEEKLGQAAGARVVDIDGDGKNELVFTGYEDGAVYVYARAGR